MSARGLRSAFCGEPRGYRISVATATIHLKRQTHGISATEDSQGSTGRVVQHRPALLPDDQSCEDIELQPWKSVLREEEA
ncbi:hypothetical protein NDU88_002409 [Pleurodeles waltl]|uniref:Uncharacterized protein n=1 Tax=Pleurodeles waltl TaxID=8319 RepID=A0AAV7WNE7_PLEWA|nr:hypothetical protein NDU88_002409 [Pleurodeles waltl]